MLHRASQMNKPEAKFNQGDKVFVAIIPEIYWAPMDSWWGGYLATVRDRRQNEFGVWVYRLWWDNEKAQSLMANEWRPETCLYAHNSTPDSESIHPPG